MKLWGGRFQKETAKLAEDFTASVDFDQKLAFYDLAGSIAHAKMLGHCGIISLEESNQIVQGLEELREELAAGKITFTKEAEDIHLNLERLLTEKIGEVGKKLHTGRSRNDQVALDLRLYLKAEIKQIADLLFELQGTLLDLAEEHLETIMPGYTHLQRAQPVSFAHHLLAYFEMFGRDGERLHGCYGRTDVMPLGAGALAGTTLPLDRAYVARELGFQALSPNSLDAVSDRDFLLEFAAAASLIMLHLSRFCEEIILWSTSEFSFCELDEAFCTGSSMMPQKKNPDVPELIRGKTARVLGNCFRLFTLLKALPLAYNRDLQEDKEALFDTVETLKGCLSIFTPLLRTLKVNQARMAAAAQEGYLAATDLAEYLVTKGVPFREAHATVGKLVLYCLSKEVLFKDLSLAEYQQFSPFFEEDIFEAVRLENCLARRCLPGGTAPKTARMALAQARERLAETKQKAWQKN